MKKYIFTESQIKKVIDQTITEQTIEIDAKKAVQCFLNKVMKPSPNLAVDGSHGTATRNTIAKFQYSRRNVLNDGIWGPSTWDSLDDKEKAIFRDCVSETGDLGDKIFHFFGIDKLWS
jgi:hypothetical protein